MVKAKNGKTAAKKPAKGRAKAVKQATKKAGKPAKASAQKKAPKKAPAELEALKKKAEEAKTELVKAKNEANALRRQAKSVESVAKKDYAEAVRPYREACKKAGVECEFTGGRGASKTEMVSFLVEKTDKGVRLMIKGKPETEELIPIDVLKASVNKAAYDYTDRWLGPKEEIGNKGGGLSNRLRKILNMKKEAKDATPAGK